MGDFNIFLKKHLEEECLELNKLSTEEVKQLIYDFLYTELYKHEEPYTDDLSINEICDNLEVYLDDSKSFYFNLIIETINAVNSTRNEPIMVKMGDKIEIEDHDSRYSFQINTNGSMKNAFQLLYHSIGEEGKEQESEEHYHR